MWIRLLALLLLVTLPAQLNAADAPDYRVAGIVRHGDAWLFAIIEAPDGTSRIFSNGDVIANEGTIVAVTNQGILVENNGTTRLLNLQGGRYTTSASKATTGEAMELSKEILRTDMRIKLESVIGKKRSSSNRQLTPGEANEILGIPSQAKITSINGTTIQKANDVLAIVQETMDQGGLLRVFVDGIEGVSHMYVILRDEQTPQ